MQRVVLDTNVVLSGMLSNFGPAAVILGLVLNRRLGLVLDERILDEYEEVMNRPRFGLGHRDLLTVLERLRRVAQVHAPQAMPGGRRGFPDPDDVMFVEAALGARADWLVTRNLKHFPPARCGGVKIITPEQVVERIDL